MPKASKRGGASRPKTHAPRKRFGQNFLTDQGVISAIARAINPQKDDNVVEIGPGQGALTDALFESGCAIKAIEIDRDLQSPLIFKLLMHLPIIRDMHFMLQKEMVDRLAARPGNKHWGRLSVMTQVDCDVEHLFDVPPEAFYPQPKVQSAIVRLTPKMTYHRPECSREELGKLVQLAFAQRRKTLRNNLRGVIDDSVMQRLGIDPACRAETLTLDQLMDLSLEIPRAAI